MATPAPDAILLGRLQRDFIINAQGQALIDRPGGNLLYAASAYNFWGRKPGLVARVGGDYPQDWIDEFSQRGFDTRGIRVLPQPQDLRRFIAYSDIYTAHREQPIKHFAKLSLSFPKALLGYVHPGSQLDSKKERADLTLRPEDLPPEFAGVKAAHLCPLDYFSHSLMPASLRASAVEIVTLDAGTGYMQPRFWNEIPELVNGLTVFLTDEEKLRNLFSGRSQDLWEMITGIAGFNCQAVVVKSLARGRWLYEVASGKRYHLPVYPARIADISSAGSSFCGAFLAALQQSQDLLRALLMGSATASLSMEGSGAFYIADSLTGLVEARIQSLEQAVQVI